MIRLPRSLVEISSSAALTSSISAGGHVCGIVRAQNSGPCSQVPEEKDKPSYWRGSPAAGSKDAAGQAGTAATRISATDSNEESRRRGTIEKRLAAMASFLEWGRRIEACIVSRQKETGADESVRLIRLPC